MISLELVMATKLLTIMLIIKSPTVIMVLNRDYVMKKRDDVMFSPVLELLIDHLKINFFKRQM